MRRSQDVIGLPVIHVRTGKRLGAVRDILFNGQQQMVGLLLENGGWVRRGRFLPFERIGSLGTDAVIVDSESDIHPLNQLEEDWHGLLTGQRKLKGRPVVMSNGQELGMVEDVYFREELGTLMGYELSGGFISDLTEGRKMFRPDAPLTWGEDVLIASMAGQPVQDV
ncbi:MAG: PRC-barrel domain-containing protein [Firmicutes bacterium]|uniref:Uncharacterized protein YrrD, contains PRC-barrel domain n=1 Tax=Melghirimyces thermohalophilus TaxID=1236220 RepID=A0A1G6MZW4_9BACL|nr:PRC-barrel domain-containing protein [Melghirimyces thermohalophilus]MDA8353428.1 PRC-barrel domain-containing protein [Bacillota bacterium]SDC61110.1 Uncharacterized protein YrrD, contains PRC-barrel domain [Melghirimyces thermohalophilus]